jgi:hypothetical protein
VILMSVNGKLVEEVAAIGDLLREDLVARWTKAHGHPPPTGVRDGLLIHSAAWHLQAKRLGGFKSQTRRLLKEAIRDLENRTARQTNDGASTVINLEADAGSYPVNAGPPKPVAEPEPGSKKRHVLRPGARLLREWNGRTHVVDVSEGGFIYESKVFRSLTAIARDITGTHWSGPRFFGL